MIYNSKYFNNFVLIYIFSDERLYYLCVGNKEKSAIKESGSSRSLKASIKSGYLYLTR